MPSCRENGSVKGCVDRSKVIGEGSFKRVYKGAYVEGKRKGQPQATKELICTTAYTGKVFEHDVAVAKRAAQIVELWNASKFIDKPVLVNIPEVWVYTGDSSLTGVTHLVEPFIENFEKFNSNTGWVPAQQRRWTELLQALSHFSYHISKRSILLCDLQGAVYSNCVVLTDPAILSNDGRYGPTDMGTKGMATFFHRHVCNQFCRPEWRRPAHTAPEFPLRYGTSMVCADGMWLMPTRETKPALASIAAADAADMADAAAMEDAADGNRKGVARWCRRQGRGARGADSKAGVAAAGGPQRGTVRVPTGVAAVLRAAQLAVTARTATVSTGAAGASGLW